MQSSGPADHEDVTNNAVFGGLEWDINDKWAATLEARWSSDEIRVQVYSSDQLTMKTGDYGS